MSSVKSFIDLPTLTRLRWVSGLGALAMCSAALARASGMLPGDGFYPLELLSAASLILYTAFAEKLPPLRNHPQAAFVLVILPLLPHFLQLNFQRHLDAGPLMALGLVIAFTGVVLESNIWRRVQVYAWTAGTLVMLWTVEAPISSPLSVSIVFVTLAILVLTVGSGYHAALKESAQTASLLEESQSFSGVGAWQRDLITGELRWSNTTYEILEIEPSEKSAINFNEFLVEPEQDSKLFHAIQHLINTGESFDIIDRLRTATGRVIWVRSRGRAEMYRGKPLRIMGVFSDITQQVEYERELTEAKEAAEAAAQARAQFLANMSHEIRTPMNGVIGMTSLLSQLDLDQQSQRHVDIIRTSGESLLNIIDDILDFSKLEVGKLQFESLPVNLHQLVNNALDVVRPSADDNNISLVAELPEEEPFDYLTDETRLRQILLNLLSNAVKFTEVGSVTVQLAITATESANADVTITVTDTGIGIPADKQAHLFDAFTQADASTTREYGGTGLGLSICSQLVTQMGGTITVDSAAGQGAAFSFTLHLRRTPRIEAVIDQVIQASHIGQNLKILLAEDNSVNQKVAVMMLDKLGYHADVAHNGKEALERVQANAYDIVFMDLQMPEMDGLTATKEIRSSTAHQPQIIALTANAMAEDKARCMEVGMDDFVPKPMRLQDLQNALDAAQQR